MKTIGVHGVPFHSYHEGSDLVLVGDVDTESARASFDTAFENAYQEAERRGVKTLAVDVVRLEFVNSSAVSVLTRWVLRAEKLGFTLKFVINPALPWQRMNFKVLHTMAPDAVQLEERPST